MKTHENSPLFAEERREQILVLLRENTKLLVPDLCEHFDVSPATIRNDLRDLEAAGKLKRTHGGAIPVGKASFEPNSTEKEVEHREEKQRIAKRACGFIEDGDTIALDTGTTTLELARLLVGKKDLTIVTNDLKIASCLESDSDASVVFIGGAIRHGFHCTTGPTAQAQLASFNVDKAFLAANALSVEKGFTTPCLDQAEVKKTMVSIAAQVFFLMDSSKLGRISFVKFADLHDADKLVTDAGVGKKAVAQLQADHDNLEIVLA